VSAEDLALWNMISIDNVETACLAKAKEQAGASANLVYSCSCDETATTARKTYGCDISTADPFNEYFANIDCFLTDKACSIETNYGPLTITFEELRSYAD
jgi:hypothetical protein